MSTHREPPPIDWPGLETAELVQLTPDIYYAWIDNTADPTFWHWCTALEGVPDGRKVFAGCWVAAGTQGHELVSRDPLHLEPSLLWRCCGLHGFVRNGAWTPA